MSTDLATPSHGLLTGRRALVTGAAQGIGFGIAEELARAGAEVIVTDLDGERAASAARALVGAGHAASGHVLDVSREDSIAAAIDAVTRDGEIHVLVNNAGIHTEARDRVSNLDDFRRCFEVNVGSVWALTQALLPSFRRHGAGRIINIASINGRTPWSETPAYSASKAAVINLTRAMAMKLGPEGITVNAVCPGSVLTPMADRFVSDTSDWLERMRSLRCLKRDLMPGDIGRAVAFFASPMADMITGQSLNVDGGVVMN